MATCTNCAPGRPCDYHRAGGVVAPLVALAASQRELLEDKFILWERASREGPMDLRDYNRRCAEALKTALAIASAAHVGSASLSKEA